MPPRLLVLPTCLLLAPAPAGYAVPQQLPPVEGAWSPFIRRADAG